MRWSEEGRYYGFPVFRVPGFKFGRCRHFEETGEAEVIAARPPRGRRGAPRIFTSRYFPDGGGPTMTSRRASSPIRRMVISSSICIPTIRRCFRLGLFRAWLQVCQRHRRDHGRSGREGVYPPRYLPLPPRPSETDTPPDTSRASQSAPDSRRSSPTVVLAPSPGWEI